MRCGPTNATLLRFSFCAPSDRERACSTPRLPAAGNDNFGGGDVLETSLLFNCNRESSDSGNVYTYNRLPFLTSVRTGTPSLVAADRHIRRSLFMLNYGSNWALDHDDGSSWYVDEGNVQLYSGTKHSTFRAAGHSKRTSNSLLLFPDAAAQPSFNPQTACGQGWGWNEEWINNTCALLARDRPYDDGCPWTGRQSNNVLRMNNTYLLPRGEMQLACNGTTWANLTEVQRHGQEHGSTVGPLPEVSALVAMARSMLGLTLST